MPPDEEIDDLCYAAQSTPPCAATAFDSLAEEQKREFWAALALKHTPGLGLRKSGILLKAYGSAYQAIQNPDNWKGLHLYPSVINNFKSEQWRNNAGGEWARAKTSGLNILLWTNPYYPALLKEIPDPPLFLYFKGNIELLTAPCVAVVGARRASPEGLAASFRISHELSKAGITVISGLARGVDSEAHKAALHRPGSTIAFLGCGLDVYYPRENKKLQDDICESGLVLSEYAPGTPPEPYQFPVRNRLISGLALGVLVVEAAGRSGSLITARLALEYGREVFAIPGKFAASKAQGSHELIRRGATPVLDPDDLLLELVPRLKDYAAFRTDITKLEKVMQNLALNADRENLSTASDTSASDAPALTPANALPPPEQPGITEENASAASADNRPANKVGAPKKPGHRHPRAASAASGEKTYPTQSEYNNDVSARILDLLDIEGPLQADSLCALLKLPAAKVSGELVVLEILGKVKRYPGMIYALT